MYRSSIVKQPDPTILGVLGRFASSGRGRRKGPMFAGFDGTYVRAAYSSPRVSVQF